MCKKPKAYSGKGVCRYCKEDFGCRKCRSEHGGTCGKCKKYICNHCPEMDSDEMSKRIDRTGGCDHGVIRCDDCGQDRCHDCESFEESHHGCDWVFDEPGYRCSRCTRERSKKCLCGASGVREECGDCQRGLCRGCDCQHSCEQCGDVWCSECCPEALQYGDTCDDCNEACEGGRKVEYVRCAGCDGRHDDVDCYNCDQKFCYDCLSGDCSNCHENVCRDDSHACSVCDQPICTNCSRPCDLCGTRHCVFCSSERDEEVCRNCSSQEKRRKRF